MIYFKRKLFIFLFTAIGAIITLAIIENNKNNKYIAKAQLIGGHTNAFNFYKNKLIEAYKANNRCPSSWKKSKHNYKYVDVLQVLTNTQYNKCYFIVTMKNDETVKKSVRGVSLIFPIDLNMSRENCYTDINKEDSYLVGDGIFCQLKIPKDILKLEDNSFQFKEI